MQDELEDLVERALTEDIGSGEVTSVATVAPHTHAVARITQKAAGVVYGLDVAAMAFRTVDQEVVLTPTGPEGVWRENGPVLEITGSAAGLLAAERTALNFLQQLSGVATLTARCVRAVEGTGARILDTRKTVPGLRLLQKQAVLAGGGVNHRIGLRLAAASARIAAAVSALGVSLAVVPAFATARMAVPGSARQLVVVSSPTADPPGPQGIATLRTYVRVGGSRGWRLVFGPWAAETGRGHMVGASSRREGDAATPIGVFRFGQTIYGNRRNPGELHYAYHRLVCGDWWDEDPFSARYNHFVHVPCGITPGFAPGSEALWTERLAYPYFGVVDFNMDPIKGGAAAPGSGIFLHSWISTATHGCVALPVSELLRVLRWLRPAEHPMIEIGTSAELAPLQAA